MQYFPLRWISEELKNFISCHQKSWPRPPTPQVWMVRINPEISIIKKLRGVTNLLSLKSAAHFRTATLFKSGKVKVQIPNALRLMWFNNLIKFAITVDPYKFQKKVTSRMFKTPSTKCWVTTIPRVASLSPPRGIRPNRILVRLWTRQKAKSSLPRKLSKKRSSRLSK